MRSRRTELAWLRQVARVAMSRYRLQPGRLVFVSHGENTTFRHEDPEGRHLLRVHRPQRHGRGVDTEVAVRSEIAWLDAIRQDTDLAVPEPVLTRDGMPTVTVTVDGRTRVCSLLRWMDGRIHEASARPVHVRRLGEAMAQLHNHADSWSVPSGFVRIRWDHDTFFGDVMIYGETPAAECWDLLPDAVRTRFTAVGERMAGILAGTEDTGLIHADLHLGNAVFERGVVKLIDFDDCGTGPRLYDVAVSLWELRDSPDYPAFKNALLAGYRTGREIETTHLDDYIALRQVAFDLWYTGTAQVNPAFAARLDTVHRWSVEMLDLLDHR